MIITHGVSSSHTTLLGVIECTVPFEYYLNLPEDQNLTVFNYTPVISSILVAANVSVFSSNQLWLWDADPNGQRTWAPLSTSRFWSHSAKAALEVQVLSIAYLSQDVAYLRCIAIKLRKRNSSTTSNVGKEWDDNDPREVHGWWLARLDRDFVVV
jgi:hypothetical protein